MAFDRVSPFGPERLDMDFAQLTCLLANIHRDPEKKPEPFTADDFMLEFDPNIAKEKRLSKLKDKMEALFKE